MNNENLKERIKQVVKKELDELKKQGWISDANKTFELFDKSDTNNKIKSILDCIKDCTSPVKIEVNDEPEIILEKIKTIFRAFSLFKLEDTRVLIIGQDPYPEQEKAMGLAFSVLQKYTDKNNLDDSLENIFKAVKVNNKKLSLNKPNTDLLNWAKVHNVLLLNTALTFKKIKYSSDKNNLSKKEREEIKKAQEEMQQIHIKAWEPFIHNIIKKVISDNNGKLAVFLWGIPAQNTFFQSVNEVLIGKETNKIEFNKESIDKNELYKNESRFKVVNKVVKKKEELDLVSEKIKVYRTNHPSPIIENKKSGKFKEYSPKHFISCDIFIENNTWKDFPEGNK